MTSIEPAAALLTALADVSEAMLGLARDLRSVRGVDSVSHPQYIRREERIGPDDYAIGTGAGARIESSCWAEFSNGIGVTFVVSVAWHDGAWAVDGAVVANDIGGEHHLAELPARNADNVLDAISALKDHTQAIIDTREDVVHKVVTGNLT